jgi:hypothetical protein
MLLLITGASQQAMLVVKMLTNKLINNGKDLHHNRE